jgi:thymidylate kinase
VGRSGRVVVLEGPSGAGKSTVVRAAALGFGWTPLNEAYDRLAPVPSLRFRAPGELFSLERTLLAEEARRYREAAGLRRRGRTVLADTGFLGPLTYTAGLVALGQAPRRVLDALGALARRPGRSYRIGLPDLIVYLDVPSRARRRRATGDPGGHPREFRARHEAVGRVERRIYRRLARGPLAGRVRFVSGGGSSTAVARRVRAALRALKTPPGPKATLGDVLALLEDEAGTRPGRRQSVLGRHR